jgi:hypothetical protein
VIAPAIEPEASSDMRGEIVRAMILHPSLLVRW